MLNVVPCGRQNWPYTVQNVAPPPINIMKYVCSRYNSGTCKFISYTRSLLHWLRTLFVASNWMIVIQCISLWYRMNFVAGTWLKLGAALHSPDEPSELSQWPGHDDSTINIVVVIIIIIIIIIIIKLSVFGFSSLFGRIQTTCLSHCSAPKRIQSESVQLYQRQLCVSTACRPILRRRSCWCCMLLMPASGRTSKIMTVSGMQHCGSRNHTPAPTQAHRGVPVT